MKKTLFSKTFKSVFLGLALLAGGSFQSFAQNPYIPLWEHLPDGEPRVFEDPDNPGKYRAYIIGSHDVRNDSYCGPDIHAWSAPVEDLNNWRDEGPIFTYFIDNQWDVMYAPDLVEIKGKDGKNVYYLYPHSRGANREAMVCKGDRPDGPFTPLNMTEDGLKTIEGSTMGFDPSVFVEKITDPKDPDYETGFRAYGFWGFQRSSAAQLDQNTMYSVRPGTEMIPYFIPASASYGNVREIPGVTYPALYKDQKLEDFNFFEASSIRQVGNKYVWVFSGHSGPDYGVGSSNSTLRYAYGDSPMGPWRSGGILVDSRAIVPNEDGSHLTDSFSGHNTHGSLLEINGQWYVFYHRAPRGFGNARQPMVAPVTIQWDEKPVAEGGKVMIKGFDPYSADNTWTAKAADGFEYTGAEVTSEGFNVYGLDPYKYYSAGYACYLSDFSVMQDTHDIWGSQMDLTLKNGNIAGFKYFGFGGLAKADRGLKPFAGTKKGNKTAFNVFLTPRTDKAFKVIVMMDGPWANKTWNGKKIAEINVPAGSAQKVTKFTADVAAAVDGIGGKHAIYLIAEGGEGVLCDLQGIGFSSKSKKISYPAIPSVTVKVGDEIVDFGKDPKYSTNANGIVFLDTFEKYITVPAGNDTKVTATSDNKKVKFTITQPEDRIGDAEVDADFNGVVKKFIVHIKDREPLYQEKEVLVAKDFEIRQIDEHTWHGNGHRVYNESFYIVEGENRALLIDCGTSLEDLNKAVAQITDKPVTLIATHVHGDHTGSAVNYYREIYINAADMVNAQTQLSNYRGRINYLTDGQIIDLGGRQIEVMFTPGHTPGSTTFFDKAAGYGFSGDAFGSTNLLLSTNFPTFYLTACRVEEYMEKNNIDRLYSGHYHGNDTESLKRVKDMKQMAREMIDGTYKGEIFEGNGNLDKYITNGEVKINYSSKTPVTDLAPRMQFGPRR